MEEMEEFFDGFAKSVPVQKIRMEELELCPNNALGGVPSGCLSIKVEQSAAFWISGIWAFVGFYMAEYT